MCETVCINLKQYMLEWSTIESLGFGFQYLVERLSYVCKNFLSACNIAMLINIAHRIAIDVALIRFWGWKGKDFQDFRPLNWIHKECGRIKYLEKRIS